MEPRKTIPLDPETAQAVTDLFRQRLKSHARLLRTNLKRIKKMVEDPDNRNPRYARGTFPYRICDTLFQRLGFREPEEHPDFVDSMDAVVDIIEELEEHIVQMHERNWRETGFKKSITTETRRRGVFGWLFGFPSERVVTTYSEIQPNESA